MDNKRLMIGMALALAILLGWNFVIVNLARKYNWDLGGGQTTPPATVQAEQTTVYGQPPVTPGVESPVAVAPSTGRLGVLPPQNPAQPLVTLGSAQFKDPLWTLGIDTQPAGAAIGSVTLNQFPRSDEQRKEPFVYQQPTSTGTASMATLSATINGQVIDLSRAIWDVAQRSDTSVTYAVNIGQTQPEYRILKTYTVSHAVQDDKATPQAGYEVQIQHRIENLTNLPTQVQLSIAGPTTPPREVERGPDLFVFAGYNKNPDYPEAPLIEPAAHGIESLVDENQTLDLTRGEKNRPLIWAGLASTYFDALVLPVGEKKIATAEFIQSVRASAIPGTAGHPVGAELIFQTKPLVVAPAQPAEFSFMAFFGPKARNIIKNDYYGSYPREYFATLSTGSSCFCTVQWLVDIMVWLLRFFWLGLRDWGLAIIALVVLVRGLMHPLTRKSTISMHQMSKLAPEMERIKKKYADKPEEQQRAMMAFYKEHGAGQLFGCLPMFIQMPIWVALWSALQGTFELRLAPFLYGLTWIDDLAKPDRLIPLPPINLFFFTVDAVNLLPILMGVFFYLQQRYTPKPASMTPEQAQQQKMMQWMMVLMFPLMLYNGPSGLNLYIFTSTAIGMLESKWIRDHIKARDAAQAATGPVIIDAEVVRASNRNEPAKPKGKIGQWIERMQKLAADAQKQAQNQQLQKKKPKK